MNKRDQKSGHRWLMVVVLWVPLIFTLSLVFWAQQSQHARDANAKLILHTVQVKEQLEHLDILIGDVETSQRGYLLTGNKVFLDLYGEAVKGIPAQSQNLALLIADNPKQVAPFTKLQAIIADKLAKAAQSISLAEQGNIFDAVQIVKAADEKP